jgi:hypothetical protein
MLDPMGPAEIGEVRERADASSCTAATAGRPGTRQRGRLAVPAALIILVLGILRVYQAVVVNDPAAVGMVQTPLAAALEA